MVAEWQNVIVGFDGFNSICEVKDPSTLLSVLPFKQEICTRTGVLREVYRTKFKALNIKLWKSEHTALYYLAVCGSIHRFFNNGASNSTDLQHANLLDALARLNAWGIDTNALRVTTLEYGVNVETQTTFKYLRKTLLTYQLEPFSVLGVRLGGKYKQVGIVVNKTQKALKIYYKDGVTGKDLGGKIRFELVVTDMQAVKPLGIKCLNDLARLEVAQGMANLLINSLQTNILAYDNSVSECLMTPKDNKLLIRYDNPKYWKQLRKQRRSENKRRFLGLIEKYGANQEFNELINAVCVKLAGVLNVKPKDQKSVTFLSRAEQNGSGKKRYLFETWVNNQKSHALACKTTPKTCNENTPLKRPLMRTCLVCNSEIEKPRPNKKYCSKKCGNIASNQNRKIKALQMRNTELLNMEAVLKVEQNFSVVLWFREQEPVRQKVKSLKPIPYGRMRKLHRLEVCKTGKAKNPVFTTLRAKKLYKNLLTKNRINGK